MEIPKSIHSEPVANVLCPICSIAAPHLDTVDFTKSCLELTGQHAPIIGIGIDYHLCDQCGFCFAPEFAAWSFQDFEKHIYNADYILVDPEYKEIRPAKFAALIEHMFGKDKKEIRHLDYGSGSGLLSAILKENGWMSSSYDPFSNPDQQIEELGCFDLITAFEVFEHVPDPVELMKTLKKLCKPTSLILFSTLLSDQIIDRSQKLTWWYAAPRNGHISLFSGRSLTAVVSKADLDYVSASRDLHMAFSQLPYWVEHIIHKN